MSLSVVIVSYNYGMFAAQAIDSVLSQTKMPDRILFVDDCSAKGDIGCEVAGKFGIEVIRREVNYGVLKNFQDILFHQVTTERMIMLGADNWLRNDAVEKMSAEEADIVSTDYYTTGSGIKETQHRDQSEICLRKRILRTKISPLYVPGEDKRKDTRKKFYPWQQLV